jgi:HK97 family phage portal protein
VPTTRAGLLNRVRNFRSKASSPYNSNTNFNSSDYTTGSSGFWANFLGNARGNAGVKRSVPQFLEAYNTQAWLRAGGAKKAQSISDVEWLTLVEDPETEQLTPLDELITTKHPLQIFFDQPHPLFSWQTILFIWSVHLDLTGECFGIWDTEGDIQQIWPITPDKITELPQLPDKPYFTLSLSSGQSHIPLEQVFWLVDPNPAAPYARGSGIAQSLDTELNIYKETGETLDGFFKRQARPDILVTGKTLNPEKTKRMEAEWREKLSGFWNSFKPYFLSEEVTVQEFKQDFQSAQFIDLVKMERDTITQILGLPPEIMGILQNSNRATIEAADLFFSKWTLRPRLNMMREAFQRQIVPRFDDTGLIELDYVSPVQEDKEFEAAIMRFQGHAFLLDEIRVKAGEEPFPDGRGQVVAWPMNMTPMRLQDLPLPTIEGVQEPEGTEVPGTPEPIMVPGEPSQTGGDTGAPQPAPPADAGTTQPTSPTQAWIANRSKGRVITTGRGVIIRLRR